MLILGGLFFFNVVDQYLPPPEWRVLIFAMIWKANID